MCVLKKVYNNLLCVTTCGVFPCFHPVASCSFVLNTSTSMLTVMTTATCHRPGCPVQLLLFKAVQLGCLTLVIVNASLLFVASDGTNKRVTRLKNTLTKM